MSALSQEQFRTPFPPDDTRIFLDNSKYEGNFHDGKYHGFGVYQRADGMKYEGTFSGGQAYGMGLLTFPDGTHGRPRQEG